MELSAWRRAAGDTNRCSHGRGRSCTAGKPSVAVCGLLPAALPRRLQGNPGRALAGKQVTEAMQMLTCLRWQAPYGSKPVLLSAQIPPDVPAAEDCYGLDSPGRICGGKFAGEPSTWRMPRRWSLLVRTPVAVAGPPTAQCSKSPGGVHKRP